MARTYFQERPIKTRSDLILSQGFSAPQNPITENAQRMICIPAKSNKIINGFAINDEIISYDNVTNPTKKSPSSKDFTLSNTPLKLKNYISYGFDENHSLYTLTNNFWVCKIENFKKDLKTTPDHNKFYLKITIITDANGKLIRSSAKSI